MENLIQSWKQRSSNSRKAQKKFIRHLEQYRGKHLDTLADEIHEEVFSKVNCLDCANCCTSIPPIVNKTDTARIAKELGMKPAAFAEKYLTVDEDNDTVMNQSPCPFLLENNECFIYAFRPKACREYPHTNNREFSKNLSYHAPNAMYCPAVFYILEEMKKRVP